MKSEICQDEDSNKYEVSIEANCDPEVPTSNDLPASQEKESTETNELSDKEDADEENHKKVADYILFDNVYPHLVSSSFKAEDEDLTKEEIENMTLKMEDVETIMLLNEKPCNNNNIDQGKPHTIPTQLVFQFESQHEQMQVLDALQTNQERIQNKLDSISMSEHSTENLFQAKKRRLRRLVQRYQDCVMQAVNGRKNGELISNLPFVLDMLDENIDVHGFKCNCCNGLYHSKRALDLHMVYCIRDQWLKLMNYVPKNSMK